jgi:hypothetical protein
VSQRYAGAGQPDGGPRTGPRALAVVSGVLHLVVGYFYLASGLLAPLAALIPLWIWWLLLGWELVRLTRRNSWWTPAVPLVAIATWAIVLTLGEQLWGWTA